MNIEKLYKNPSAIAAIKNHGLTCNFCACAEESGSRIHLPKKTKYSPAEIEAAVNSFKQCDAARSLRGNCDLGFALVVLANYQPSIV